MTYSFTALGEFRNRQPELGQMRGWWENARERRALSLYGRRRVGKSWLFRAFANGKPADIFVADSRAERDQLIHFARQLEPELGLRPDLPDIGTFLRLLYRRARETPRVAIIDEFPFLWQVNRDLPTILLRVMEEEVAGSRLKLIICGSMVAMMEELFAERSPFHDRAIPLPVHPFDFSEAVSFLGGFKATEAVERFAIAGGMPRYLAEFSFHQPLKSLILTRVLNRLGPLFNEPRALLAQELVAPHNYFSILAALSYGPHSWGDLVARSGVEDKSLGKYLATLIRLRIVEDRLPVTEEARDVRRRQYRIRDGFVSFWFRFVFPFQAELEEGLDPIALYRSQIEPNLPSHVAPVFESLARSWVRRTYGHDLTRVGAWWGLAQHALRRTGARTSEEIDLVGLSRRTIKVVGECRWRRAPMDVAVLAELRNFKMPALAQVPGVTMAPDCRILLFSRAGFTKGLQRVAAAENVQLVNADQVVGVLGARSMIGRIESQGFDTDARSNPERPGM